MKSIKIDKKKDAFTTKVKRRSKSGLVLKYATVSVRVVNMPLPHFLDRRFAVQRSFCEKKKERYAVIDLQTGGAVALGPSRYLAAKTAYLRLKAMPREKFDRCIDRFCRLYQIHN